MDYLRYTDYKYTRKDFAKWITPNLQTTFAETVNDMYNFNITCPTAGQFFLLKCRHALGDHAGDYTNYTKLHETTRNYANYAELRELRELRELGLHEMQAYQGLSAHCTRAGDYANVVKACY